MRRLLSHWQQEIEPLRGRLDRAAAQINPFLLVIVMMLGVVYMSCEIALLAGRIMPPPAAVDERPGAADPAFAATARLPPS
jgi:hypothetical protein